MGVRFSVAPGGAPAPTRVVSVDGPHRARRRRAAMSAVVVGAGAPPGATPNQTRASLFIGSLVLGMLLTAGPVWGADYGGPLIDAHSHLPNATAIDAYVAAMKRHNVVKVVLLGVGGLQKDDTAWLTAASKKYPDRVVAGLPLADPTSESAASQLELQLDRGKPRVIGEVHMRQVGRRLIDRDPNSPVFGKILDTAAKFEVPIVIHYELTDAAETALDRALAAHRKRSEEHTSELQSRLHLVCRL